MMQWRSHEDKMAAELDSMNVRQGGAEQFVYFLLERHSYTLVGIELEGPFRGYGQVGQCPVPLVGIVLETMLYNTNTVRRTLQSDIHRAIRAVRIDDEDLLGPASDRVKSGCEVRLFVERQNDD